jgi:hypothetical protein
MTLTLGLELHPFKASSVGRLGLAALLQMPQTCQPMSIGLTICALLRHPRLLSNRPSTTTTTTCLPIQQRNAVTNLAANAELASVAHPLAMH